ncbi:MULTISPECIES: LURP-one-related/scramblase family protein [Peptoniphilus]|uniref:LURP-one-related/scramblase family protein n=1 Tax=Peptoniphilus TaxID=162289 RepID=UPI0001DA9C4F|nr:MULTISPECIES: LURP-one-related family protein [Peptoniphilus]EFI42624.1 hypothetical protein HMPREF0629_01283 [Peptoniphilus sp. oral taxon 386 str. F0131]
MHNLYVKQKVFKITDHYEVLDYNQNAVYYVDQDFKIIGNTVNVTKADGSGNFVIDREIFTLMPRYNVKFSDGRSFVIKQNFTFFRKDIDVISDEYSLKLEGNFLDLNFSIYDSERLVGEISQEILAWGDTFVIRVIEPEYEEELLALLIAVDDIKDMQQH